MATQYLISFPEFSESKEFLKIGRWGKGAKSRTTKSSLLVFSYNCRNVKFTYNSFLVFYSVAVHQVIALDHFSHSFHIGRFATIRMKIRLSRI